VGGLALAGRTGADPPRSTTYSYCGALRRVQVLSPLPAAPEQPSQPPGAIPQRTAKPRPNFPLIPNANCGSPPAVQLPWFQAGSICSRHPLSVSAPSLHIAQRRLHVILRSLVERAD
jgi:hypothetical protein